MQIKIMDERMGKFPLINRFQIVQHLTQTRRQQGVRPGSHPAIEAESGKLPFQHRGRVKENPGGIHPAGQHFLGRGEKIEIMRPGVGHHQVQGIAVPAARPADSLQIIRLGRRHRTENQ